MEREIVHIDIASFAVAVERVVHPELRERPVVVAPLGAARAVVVALSPEAWQAGIRRGMALAKAVRYCREVIALPPNESLYARAARAIWKILQNFSPVFEPSGYGHAYIDITGTGRLFGPPRDTAWRVQQELRRQLRLEASCGVATNKMVSKIASVVTRPVGLQDVPPGDEASFLSPLPVDLLPGVGERTRQYLEELNIRVIHDIMVMQLEHLTLAFGRMAFLLRQRALGIDNTPVYASRAMPAVEHEEILAEDSNDYAKLKASLSGLCERTCEKLRAGGQRAGRIEVCVRYSDYKEEAGKETIAPPAQSTAVLRARAESLLERVLTRRTRVRSLRLRLSDISRGPVQLDLFADPKPARQARLDSALDLLRHRHGADIVHCAFRIAH